MPRNICPTQPTQFYDDSTHHGYNIHGTENCPKCFPREKKKVSNESTPLTISSLGSQTNFYSDRSIVPNNQICSQTNYCSDRCIVPNNQICSQKCTTENIIRKSSKTAPSPPQNTPFNSIINNEKTLTNTICVKQPGGKHFTISLVHPPSSPRGRNKPKVTVTRGKDCGPVSIVIHSTPKNKANTHPCFNTLADRKSNAVIDSMKEKLSYKIHSPADNLKISLVGDTLANVVGNPKSYPAMLLKGGGRTSSPPPRHREEAKVAVSPKSPKSSKCASPQEQYNLDASNNSFVTNSSNAIQLSMPGSGVKLNIKLGKGTQVNYGGTSNSHAFRATSPKSDSTCGSHTCNNISNEKPRFLFASNDGGYSQPTISSLIASRMTQLKREMSMNSLIPNAPAPTPPFINF